MKKLIFGAMVALATPAMAEDATDIVIYSAAEYQIPIDFALKVAQRESGVRCNQVGRAGERGPMQVMPKTAEWLGFDNVESLSCAEQTMAGMKHLKLCFDGADGDVWLAAACHNQGISALDGKVKKSAARYADAVVNSSVN